MTRIFIALAALLLSSCAVLHDPVYEPYWKPGVYTPVAGEPDVRYVRDVAEACKSDSTFISGCWVPGTNIVYIKIGLSAEYFQCMWHHEVEMHMRLGYGHGKDAPPVDRCGYGVHVIKKH